MGLTDGNKLWGLTSNHLALMSVLESFKAKG